MLSLDTLELRRLHFDLIMCHEIVFNIVKLKFADFFSFIPVTVIRSHPPRLFVPFARSNTRLIGKTYLHIVLSNLGITYPLTWLTLTLLRDL